MRIYNVYDTLNNEQYVMSGTANQIARKLYTKPKYIKKKKKIGYLIHKRYKIILDEELSTTRGVL